MSGVSAVALLCFIGGVIGAIMYLFGSIMLLIEEFKESIVWGILGLCISVTHLIFICVHFDKSVRPLAYMIGGFVLMVVGFAGYMVSSGITA